MKILGRVKTFAMNFRRYFHASYRFKKKNLHENLHEELEIVVEKQICIVDKLVPYTTRLKRYLLANHFSHPMIYLYKPHLLDNDDSWQFFQDDRDICCFLLIESKLIL